jgi:protein-S-isoprenylcysteine O-methyltransferase Ste14
MQRGPLDFSHRRSPGAIFGAAMELGLTLSWIWPVQFLSTIVSFVVGFFTMLGAAHVMTLGARELVRIKTSLSVRKPATALAEQGVYGVSRNPIYGGLVLLNIGLACFLNSLWILLLSALLAVLLQKGAIEPEEVYLEKKFGERYLRYKARVRRWI